MDEHLESLVALVAESYGFTCSFSGGSARLRGPLDVDLPLAELRRQAGSAEPEDLPTLVSEHLALVRASAPTGERPAAAHPHIEDVDLGGLPGRLITGGRAGDLSRVDSRLGVGDHGALLVVPVADVAVAHSVESVNAVRAIERLRIFARRLCESDPDPVSPYVHWWRRTGPDLVELVRINADIDGNRLVVAPPPQFSKILVRLAGA